MPNIPEFQRERFASSLVGTPGEDRSGQIIGQAVTKAAGQIENAAFDIAVKRQKAMDDSIAVRKSTEMRIAADALAADAESEFANFDGDPNDRATAMRARYEDLFTKSVEDVKSPGARRQIEAFGQDLIGTYTINEAKKGRANQSVMTARNTLDTVNLISTRAASVGRDTSLTSSQQYMALQGMLQEGEAAYKAGYVGYSVEDRHKLVKQIPETIAKSFLMNMVTHNPEDVKGFVESGQFDSLLDPTERTKVLNDAVAAIPKVRERRELENLASLTGAQRELFDAYASGDPDILKKIAAVGDTDPVGKSLRDLVIKGAVDPEDKADAILALDNMRDAMLDPKKQVKKGTQLKDISSFMKTVMDYRTAGLITDSAVNNYRTKFINPLHSAIMSEGKPSANLGLGSAYLNLTTGGMAGGITDWFFKKNAKLDSPTARAIVSKSFMDAYDPNVHRTKDDVRKLAKDVLVGYANTAIPALGLVVGTPNKVQHPDRQQSVVSTGKSDVKGAVALKSNGAETKRVPDGKGNWFLVDFKNGKPVGKPRPTQ